MKVIVMGATGLVGSKMLEVLEERNFPIHLLIPVASERSKGKKIRFKGSEFSVITPHEALTLNADLALFSAGGATSLEWAEAFANQGCYVIDNSSAWRMDSTKKLIVPEVNAHVLNENDLIIANPNCSTIQMVVALAPLHKAYGIKRIVVSTYQSVTGTGIKAVNQLKAERAGQIVERVYPYPIDLNLIPQIDVFLENGYTKEEMKMVLETKKILGTESISITSTTVRVPVMGGHSESVNVEFHRDFDLAEVKKLLHEASGVVVLDKPSDLTYPMPLYAEGKDDVFVGRLRRDEGNANTLNMWIVSDNLRKGAATNAVQIAEILLKQGWIDRS